MSAAFPVLLRTSVPVGRNANCNSTPRASRALFKAPKGAIVVILDVGVSTLPSVRLSVRPITHPTRLSAPSDPPWHSSGLHQSALRESREQSSVRKMVASHAIELRSCVGVYANRNKVERMPSHNKILTRPLASSERTRSNPIRPENPRVGNALINSVPLLVMPFSATALASQNTLRSKIPFTNACTPATSRQSNSPQLLPSFSSTAFDHTQT